MVPESSSQIADTELEIKTHSYKERVQRQDDICLSIKEYVQKVCPKAGSVYVWLQLSEELVNEIYFDVEPLLFGKGIKLFKDADFGAKLELVGTKKLSKNEIELHYKVKEIVDVVKEF